MSLTDEEKKKIDEEERYRAEARKKAESEVGKSDDESSSNSGCSGCFLIVFGVVAAFFIIGTLSHFLLSPNENLEEKRCQGDTGMAWSMAKQFIEPRLKSPSTAEFPWPHTDSMVFPTGKGCTYQIKSYVDAQNSFGATIRSHFTAKIEYLGNGKWHLSDLKFK